MMKEKNWRQWLISFLGVAPEDKHELLQHLHEIQTQGGYFNKRTMEMIEGVLSISDWQIRDVMIPKNDIVSMSVDDGYESAVRVVCDNQHSRYPVFLADGEHISGILMAKDLLRFIGDPDKFCMKDVMRKAIFQPLAKNLESLLDDFRHYRTHMVVVVDEHELPVGIVTIEDVIERIVGEIEDEYDDEEDQNKINAADGSVLIKGSLSVEEFNALFNTQLPEDGVDSIAGWLAAQLGQFPAVGARYEEHGKVFEVLKADDRRIYKIKISSISGKKL